MAADFRLNLDVKDLESCGALVLRLEFVAGGGIDAVADEEDARSEDVAVEEMIERGERFGTP